MKMLENYRLSKKILRVPSFSWVSAFLVENTLIHLKIHCYVERRAHEALVPVYEKRRAIAKSIPKFWPVALLNHSMFGFHSQHHADQLALSSLEDIWVDRDSNESRAFSISFVCVFRSAVSRVAIDNTYSISKKTRISQILC